jgi:hypothetical protein
VGKDVLRRNFDVNVGGLRVTHAVQRENCVQTQDLLKDLEKPTY